MLYGFILLIVLGCVLLYLIRKRLHVAYDRREFEFKVAEYMAKKGFKKVEVGKGSGDGGRDCKGYKNGKLYLVQAKLYKRSSVGVAIVRELVGVCALHDDAIPVLAVLHTTKLSKQAKRYSKAMKILVWRF